MIYYCPIGKLNYNKNLIVQFCIHILFNYLSFLNISNICTQYLSHFMVFHRVRNFTSIFCIFSMKIHITFSKFFITKSKFEENAILKPLDVHVLLHLWHFPTNSKIVQILYIKRTYILCNNIQ